MYSSCRHPKFSAELEYRIFNEDLIGRTKTLVVCFSGAITNRELKSGPFFSGENVAKETSLPVVAIADNSVTKFPIALGWYAGNQQELDFQLALSEFLQELYEKYSQDIILMGGSGGGYCAIQQLTLSKVPMKAFVWNPQSSITKYYSRPLFEYVNTAFSDVINDEVTNKKECRDVFNSLGISHEVFIDNIPSYCELIYFQNLSDHFIPFIGRNAINRLGKASFKGAKENVYFHVGDWGQGHAPLPASLIFEILLSIEWGRPAEGILNRLEKGLFKSFHSKNEFEFEF